MTDTQKKDQKPGLFQEFSKGLLKENPVLILLLGMCPTLAVTNNAINGFGMGVATLFVLIGSNTVISLIRTLIPKRVRIRRESEPAWG